MRRRRSILNERAASERPYRQAQQDAGASGHRREPAALGLQVDERRPESSGRRADGDTLHPSLPGSGRV